MWVPKLLISPVIIRIFCPKTTKFGPNLAFLSIAGSFGALLVGWLVVMARAVSRKTPIYFIIHLQFFSNAHSRVHNIGALIFGNKKVGFFSLSLPALESFGLFSNAPFDSADCRLLEHKKQV